MSSAIVKRQLLAFAALLCAPAMAANLLVNSSFEDLTGVNFGGISYCYLNGVPGSGSNNCLTVPGWASNSNPTLIASNSSPWNVPSAIGGWNAAFGNTLVGLQQGAEIHQTLNLGQGTYTLTWNDAQRNDASKVTSQNYSVTLGGTVLGTFATQVGAPWTAHSINFSTAGGALSLSFNGLVTTSDATAFIDNVALNVSAVSEPNVFLMLGTGLACVGLVVRRRRQV